MMCLNVVIESFKRNIRNRYVLRSGKSRQQARKKKQLEMRQKFISDGF